MLKLIKFGIISVLSSKLWRQFCMGAMLIFLTWQCYQWYEEYHLGPKVSVFVPCYQQVGPNLYIKVYTSRTLPLYSKELRRAMADQDTVFLKH